MMANNIYNPLSPSRNNYAAQGISAYTENCNRDLNDLYTSLSLVGKLSLVEAAGGTQKKDSRGMNRSQTHIDVLKVDAVTMLKSTNKEMKTLLHNLNKVVKTGEDFHKELIENVP